jgi:orotidine-5'-phosphate decarboxylase
MIGQGFVERYNELSEEKNSFLCVGIDPATIEMRDKYVIPPELTENDRDRGIMEFCINIIKSVGPYTPIIKPNAQFLLYNFGYNELKEIVDIIHEVDCLALLDIKLSDIGSTMDAGLFWVDILGFDAVTFSPFPGYENGTDAVYNWAERGQKGIFVLCRMSNPGTNDYQSKNIEDMPLYQRIAKDASNLGCNGYVVGATATEELEIIRRIIGENPLILSPGLGPQGGDPRTALRRGANKDGGGMIVSSSRSINYAYEIMGKDWMKYAELSGEAAKSKRDQLNSLKEEIFK